jgi:hypothetical protein
MTALKTGAYTCRLGDNCAHLATVQIVDQQGSHTRGCFVHSLEAMKAITGAKVVWAKTKVNEFARKALEMTESRIGN